MQVLDGCSDLNKPVPINTKKSITLDSPLFQGTINIQIRCAQCSSTSSSGSTAAKATAAAAAALTRSASAIAAAGKVAVAQSSLTLHSCVSEKQSHHQSSIGFKQWLRQQRMYTAHLPVQVLESATAKGIPQQRRHGQAWANMVAAAAAAACPPHNAAQVKVAAAAAGVSVLPETDSNCTLCLPLSPRGLKSTDDKYFTGKKRYTHLVMQGRFKHDVNASDLWTGHEWFQISNLVPTRYGGTGNSFVWVTTTWA